MYEKKTLKKDFSHGSSYTKSPVFNENTGLFAGAGNVTRTHDLLITKQSRTAEKPLKFNGFSAFWCNTGAT
jgi:hypothetical protein